MTSFDARERLADEILDYWFWHDVPVYFTIDDLDAMEKKAGRMADIVFRCYEGGDCP